MDLVPRVSVIIPVHNSDQFLRQCLDSISSQTLRDIEIICVDDGSTDGSMAILEDYSSLDSRFVILHQECLGAAEARNKGLKIARGEWLAFLDSDDFFEPTMLEETYATGVASNADIVCFPANSYEQTTGKITFMPWTLKTSLIPETPCCTSELYDRLFQIVKPQPWTKLFRCSFIRGAGIEYQNLHNSNDLYFTFMALSLSKKLAWVEKPLVNYRRHADSTQAKKRSHPEDFYLALKALKEGLVSRGLFDQLKLSYDVMADEMFDWCFNSYSFDDVSAARREELRAALEVPHLGDQDVSGDSVDEDEGEGEFSPCVSVVIPVYNSEDYIEECVNSVLSQSMHDLEIVCVDDGSSDRSVEILEKMSAADSRIRIVSNACNMGRLEARRNGVLSSKGEYIFFLDADDRITPTVCEEAYKEAITSGADIVHCSMEVEYYTEVSLEHMQWRKKYLAPYTGTLRDEGIMESAFCTQKYTTLLIGKLFQRDLCLKAHSCIPSIRLNAGEDILVFFYIAYYANCYVGLDTEGCYLYCFGRGISNLDNMDIDTFEKYASMGKCESFVWEFLNSEHALSRCYRPYTSMLERMLTDSLRIYRDRLLESDKCEAARIIMDYWKDSEVLNSCLQDFLKVSLKEFLASNHIQLELRSSNSRSVGMGASEPKVSVIVPCYNVSRYVGSCLDSLLRQTLTDIEIICVNDGSCDSTLDILENYASLDSRISIISKENGGLSSARNAGLSCARGKYVYYLDSDDSIASTCLEVLWKKMEECDLDILLFSGVVHYETTEIERDYSDNRYYYYRQDKLGGSCSGQMLFSLLLDAHSFRSSACLQIARREYLESVDARFFEGILHEDNLYTFEVLLQAHKAMKIDSPLFVRLYRRGSIMTSSTTARNVEGYLESYVQIMAFLATHSLDRTIQGSALEFAKSMRRRVLGDYSKLEECQCELLKGLDPVRLYVLNTLLSGGGEDARAKVREVKESNSYRIGRAVTWIPRKLKKLLKKYLK